MSFINSSEFNDNDSYAMFGPLEIYNDKDTPDDPVIVKATVSAVLVINMLISLIGNACVCAVVFRDKTMRTPTNCYLVNLAIMDFLMALFIPQEIYFIWLPIYYPFGEIGCRTHFVIWDFLSTCSVLTIVAFTVERYLVVTNPFLRQKLSLKSRVIKIMAATWFVSWLQCIPGIFYTDFVEQKLVVFCYINLSDFLKIVLGVDILVLFVAPMTMICVLYMLIALKLKETRRKLRTSPVNGKHDRVKAVKMLAAVAGLFFYGWAPYCVYKVLVMVNKYKTDDYHVMWRTVYYLTVISVYFATAVNPILYSLMSRKFRRAFKDFLKQPRLSTRTQTRFDERFLPSSITTTYTTGENRRENETTM